MGRAETRWGTLFVGGASEIKSWATRRPARDPREAKRGERDGGTEDLASRPEDDTVGGSLSPAQRPDLRNSYRLLA
jgi:hypothetical protein